LSKAALRWSEKGGKEERFASGWVLQSKVSEGNGTELEEGIGV